MLGNRRVTGKEQFYTPPEVADHVVGLVINSLPSTLRTPWLEPCGGTATFLDAFERAGISTYWSCDIEPHDPRVTLSDFLTARPPADNYVCVTNPPFGRNNKLSIPFFNRAAELSSVIAFIVPRSWRKWSVTNRLNPYFHLRVDEDLSINYQTADGTPASKRGTLQTCVQIWEKHEHAREKVTVPDRGFIKRSTPEEADVSLTIFGRGCGTVKTDFPRKPNTTQMFLTVSDSQVIDALEKVDFSRFFNNVAYTEALSIKEINFLLNEYFDRQDVQPVVSPRTDLSLFDY